MMEEGLGDYANPSSIFKGAEMLLRHIGFAKKADVLAQALHTCNDVERKVVVTGTKEGATCREFADYVLETIATLK